MTLIERSEEDIFNFKEKAEFTFVWRITLVYSIICLFMTIFTYVNNERFFIYYLSVFGLTLIGLVLLKKIKAYRSAAIVIFLNVTVIIALSIFTLPESLHIQEAVWMVVIILTAFFALGDRWGIFYLVLNTIFFFIYYNFIFADYAHQMHTITDDELFVLSIEFAIAMFLIGFVMIQYELVVQQAVDYTSKAYEDLKNEKQIVEHQNREKTALLQEIHHRVKNNLQVIVSLLRMQSLEIKSDEAKDSFKDAINRILTMSLIHQKLYEKESLVDVDIKDYLESLIKNIIDTSSIDNKIEFNIVCDLHGANPKIIVPLGLIINELVNNSIKHAFEGDGYIELTLTPEEDNKFTMIYLDNGSWKENDNPTFGSQLIEVFTEQLNGTFQRKSDDFGTRYTFHLSEED